jgi:hypothetical protein
LSKLTGLLSSSRFTLVASSCHLSDLLALHADVAESSGNHDLVTQFRNQFRRLLRSFLIADLRQVRIEGSCNEGHLRNSRLQDRFITDGMRTALPSPCDVVCGFADRILKRMDCRRPAAENAIPASRLASAMPSLPSRFDGS